MDNSSLDLSKVFSLIMENPGLVSQIKSMVENGEKAESVAEELSTSAESEGGEELSLPSPSPKVAVGANAPTESMASNRKKLLSAFKPYLSGQRQKALDSIVTIADVIDTMKAR